MTDDFESPKTSADETDMRTRKAWSTPQLTVSAADDAEAGPGGVTDAGIFS
ncbi:hypothetical protein ABIE65_001692 [Constrictibacter sp. MBR-5]|jgi:hypothetical protein|uniref:hypothetical protein n=1 Tax=Constrictibacter sp. MBR-5 TaxID=3156467 RepID=UPI003394A020